MTYIKRETMLDVGEALFGSKVFLVAAIEARHAGRFFQSQLGVDAMAGIKRLEGIGMIKRTRKRPEDHGYGSVWYEVTKHPYWRVITMVEAALVGLDVDKEEKKQERKKERKAKLQTRRREAVLAEIATIEAGLRG